MVEFGEQNKKNNYTVNGTWELLAPGHPHAAPNIGQLHQVTACTARMTFHVRPTAPDKLLL